jgi:hypothetical protein
MGCVLISKATTSTSMDGFMCMIMLIICTIDELCVDFRKLPPAGVWPEGSEQ